MVKRLSEWTYRDVVTYRNLRAQDGRWPLMTAMSFCDFARIEPKYYFAKNLRLERWWQQNKHILLDLTYNPQVNIETGEVIEDEN